MEAPVLMLQIDEAALMSEARSGSRRIRLGPRYHERLRRADHKHGRDKKPAQDKIDKNAGENDHAFFPRGLIVKQTFAAGRVVARSTVGIWYSVAR